MKIMNGHTGKIKIGAAIAVLAVFLVVSLSVAGDIVEPMSDEQAVSDGQSMSDGQVVTDGQEVADGTMVVPLAIVVPAEVNKEMGAEPHARFGYERPVAALSNTIGRHKVFQYMPDASRSLGLETMLSELSTEVAGKVFYELKDDGQKDLSARVAVVAAVPLSDLKRETEFGRIIAEYYLTDLADRGLNVRELRMGSEINILPQTGEFILSRNSGEIANNKPELDYVVASTFTNTRKTLILQGRLISLTSGFVKTSWRYHLPMNKELVGLLQNIDQQPFTIAVKGIGQN